MNITEEDWEVMKHRMEAMPSHIRLAIGPGRILSKQDILAHIEKRDLIGERIVIMQMNYLRFFKKEMATLVSE